ncbi:MAG: EamA family transporter RarD [Deltaproteobacteria bacterium]|nr:MAG: EamA family transporter RarD [Deltaproteobacteria bacterium]
MNRGALLAVGAYVLWGLFPIYWKQLHSVAAVEIIAHRVIWSLVFVAGVVVASGRLKTFLSSIRSLKVVMIYALEGALLTINWTTYVWGVNAGYVVEASLGYFINPLVSVLLGVIFLRERLRPWQWAAIAIATIGVVYLAVRYGSLPWIGLVLAFTFGIYGLIKKCASLEAMEGQALEMAVIALPALAYLLFLESQGIGTFGHNLKLSGLLALAGAVTATPLLMFAAAARRIPLSMVGILQYIAPSLQFSIGVWVYGEEFSTVRLTGFCFIWAALAIYTLEGLYVRRRAQLEDTVKVEPVS